MPEFGFVMEPAPRYTAPLAARLETLGFDILLCPDTQNLCPEPYGQLSLAAAATRNLRIGTGVTNPITRVAATTASAIAALQAESGGRAICGLGRGDSSAAHIGRRNATTAELRNYCRDVQAYLRGGEVLCGSTASVLRWLDVSRIPPAPVDIACTGPQTIRMAADVAERVSFAVGSAPERIAWALGEFRDQLERSGRPRDQVRVGAYVIVVCRDDEYEAFTLARTMAGLFAHLAALKGTSLDHLPRPLESVARSLRTGYDMRRHNLSDGSHLGLIDDAFVDWFAICGPSSKCIDRLSRLLEMGLDHLYILGGTPEVAEHGPRWAETVRLTEPLAERVLPVLRQQRS